MSKPSERIGEVVGQRYELEAVIGQGGQGTVYRALDRWSQRLVAIKIVGAKATESSVVERLMRELEALNALQGTAAVQVLDTFRGSEGEVCLVLELLVGRDFDQYLYDQRGRERMRPERVVEILDPIVSTLEVAHAAGILHRDLKPANIFLLDPGGVRLLDFGMARLKKGAPLTAPGTVMGSPSFMAPEAWQGLSDLLDPRADVYSLAVIIFFALTGELPSSGQTLVEKFLGTTQGKHHTFHEFRPDLPPRADEWLTRALATDRNQRFGSVGELWDAFFLAFQVKPPAHRRRSFWARAIGAVQRIAGTTPASRPANDPLPAAAASPEGSPSAVHEPLIPIMPQASTAPQAPKPQRTVQKTIPLEEGDLMSVEVPAPRAVPPPRRPEGQQRQEPLPEAQSQQPEPPQPELEQHPVEKTVSVSVELIPDPGAPPRPVRDAPTKE